MTPEPEHPQTVVQCNGLDADGKLADMRTDKFIGGICMTKRPGVDQVGGMTAGGQLDIHDQRGQRQKREHEKAGIELARVLPQHLLRGNLLGNPKGKDRYQDAEKHQTQGRGCNSPGKHAGAVSGREADQNQRRSDHERQKATNGHRIFTGMRTCFIMPARICSEVRFAIRASAEGTSRWARTCM